MKYKIIEVAKYYGDRSYYEFMPRSVFNALETAFIAREATASVPEEDFNSMVSAYAGK